ncbi:MAG: hypothetical protein IJR83_04915 [Clostridia bacterium]|nr:hypothetical protein [Clostridia bacterium]
MLALRGDPDGFSHKPSRTPELTNTGSFEKCWRLIDGEWWIYKSGNQNEYFSELFISRLGEKLGLDMVHYEMDDGYIRAKNFVSGRGVNFEPISSIMGDNDDFGDCFRAIADISSELSMQNLQIVWMDTICYNMDRHTENFGFLRDVHTGEIVSMAPNYDNNIALISRGYPSDVSRKHDGLIRFFKEFLENNPDAALMFKEMFFPVITAEIIHECISDIPLECDEEYLDSFILNGQRIVSEIIRSYDTHMLQEAEESFDLKM